MSAPPRPARPLLIVLALILAIVGVAAHKLWPLVFLQHDTALAAQVCNPASERCAASLPDGGQLVFSISPAPIRPLKTLELSVLLERQNGVERVEVDFSGVEMPMGINRSALTRDGERYTGQALLPMCITDRMTWAATVLLTRNGRTLAVPFHFDVSAR